MPKPKPYRIEISTHGCPLCQSDAQWDIIGPDETAQSQTWGNMEEAEYICSLMNLAHQVGRTSYAQQVLNELKAEEKENAEKKTEAIPELPPSASVNPDDDIPF
jgi:hypothetical protein